MNYNQREGRYEIGLGLYFIVTNKHIHYPGQWICRSNIPNLDIKFLSATNEAEAIVEVEQMIKRGIHI